MRKAMNGSLLLLLVALVISCASTFELTRDAKMLRNQMTQSKAEELLKIYIQPTSTRGGICLIGQNTLLTRLNYEIPPVVSEAKIHFTGSYAVLRGASTRGDILSGTRQVRLGYTARQAKSSVDTRTLKEIRVLETNDALLGVCKRFKPGYVVVLKPEKGLPDQGEITFNATNQIELGTILAVLSFMSPQARLVAGVGM